MGAQERADQKRPRGLGVDVRRVDEALDGVGELGGRHAEGFLCDKSRPTCAQTTQTEQPNPGPGRYLVPGV